MDDAKAAIVQAIQQGAPIYNSGNPKGCYELYRATATSIIESGIAPPCVDEALSSAIAAASKLTSPGDSAWALRGAFDDILDGRVEALAKQASVPEGAEEVLVLDFGAGMTGPRWLSMDDGIMGGLSSSSFGWEPGARAAIFQGNVTTANNGGFASVRSDSWGGFSAFQRARGIRMEVQGDGRVYKLSAKPEDGYDGIMYQRDFETTDDGQWRTVDLPFSSFNPNFRGRLVPGRPPLSGAQVRQLGLMVSKFSDAGGTTAGFRTGPFRLAVRSIRGFF